MSNPKPPVDISRDTISDFADSLGQLVTKLKSIEIAMQNREMQEIPKVLNFPSGKDGLLKLWSFYAEVEKAFGLQLATRSLAEVAEPKIEYKKASQTADSVNEKAEKITKGTTKKKSS